MLSCGNQPETSSPSDFVDGVATALQNGGNVDLNASDDLLAQIEELKG